MGPATLGAILTKDGNNILKDTIDHRNATVLKRSLEVSLLAIRALEVLSNFSRVIVFWTDDLLQEADTDPLAIKRSLLKIKRAAQFSADDSQDAIQFSAHVAIVVVHRNVWLKHWKIDPLSKSNLATAKFSGRLLFGDQALDKVLMETKEKKKAMPSSLGPKDKQYKGRTLCFFCLYRATGRGRDSRDFRNNRSFSFKNRFQRKQFSSGEQKWHRENTTSMTPGLEGVCKGSFSSGSRSRQIAGCR